MYFFYYYFQNYWTSAALLPRSTIDHQFRAHSVPDVWELFVQDGDADACLHRRAQRPWPRMGPKPLTDMS